MARLVECSVCALHIHAHEQQCPHCGAPQRSVAAPRTSAILLGLTLAGCPSDDSGDDTAGTGTASASGTTQTTGSTGTNATTDDSLTGSGGVEYGSADTFGETTTDTAADTTADTTADTGTTGTGSTGTDGSTGGSETAGEPEYGVPETTG